MKCVGSFHRKTGSLKQKLQLYRWIYNIRRYEIYDTKGIKWWVEKQNYTMTTFLYFN